MYVDPAPENNPQPVSMRHLLRAVALIEGEAHEPNAVFSLDRKVYAFGRGDTPLDQRPLFHFPLETDREAIEAVARDFFGTKMEGESTPFSVRVHDFGLGVFSPYPDKRPQQEIAKALQMELIGSEDIPLPGHHKYLLGTDLQARGGKLVCFSVPPVVDTELLTLFTEYCFCQGFGGAGRSPHVEIAS